MIGAQGTSGQRLELDAPSVGGAPRNLDSLDQHVGGVGGERLQVVWVGGKDGAAGFGECDDEGIDG